jgi:hypothetical protein
MRDESNQSCTNLSYREAAVTVTATATMWDAAQIAAPSGIPPLPAGSFFFPLGAVDEQERSCIEPSRESIAWSCGTSQTLMLMDFNYDTNNNSAKLKMGSAAPMAGSNGILYGPQPPHVADQNLMWVSDVRDPGKGPALHFQTAYDKLVIFEGNSFPAPALQQRDEDGLEKRHDTMPMDQGPHHHRFANQPGETPWYCYWNQTFLEGFIYIQQPVRGAETQVFKSSSMAVMTGLIHTTSTMVPMASSPPTPTSAPPILVEMSTSVPKQQLLPRATINPRDAAQQRTLKSSVTSSGAQPTQTGPPTRFPYIIKLEERRLPNPAFQPYCQRMQVKADGTTVPLLKDGVNPIVEIVREAPTNQNDAQVTAGVTSGQSGHQRKYVPSNLAKNIGPHARRRFDVPLVNMEIGVELDGTTQLLKRNNREPSNSCHCVWVSPMS